MSQEQDTPAAVESYAPDPHKVQMVVGMIRQLPITPQERFAVAVVTLCQIVEEANSQLPDHPGNPFKDVRANEENPFYMALDAIQSFIDSTEPRPAAPAFAG